MPFLRSALRSRAGLVKRRLRQRSGGLDSPPADLHATRPSRLSDHEGPTGLLVERPVFLLSSVRSGSTLLRMMLDSHSAIYAPHEMHLSSLEVTATRPNAAKALRQMRLDERLLENVLWDRVLHLRLAESGKQIVVDKTPNTTLHWERVAAFWPRALGLVLLRHPLRIVESLVRSRPDIETSDHYKRVTRYAHAIAGARAGMTDVLTVHYEQLTAQPEQVSRQICDWLGVDFEAAMLDYGAHEHDGHFKRGLGDWSENIRSGTIKAAPPEPAPADVPSELHEACRVLGYPTPAS